MTPVTVTPEAFPAALHPFLRGRLLDSSCSREARVLFLPDEGLFLKRAPLGTLKTEAEMTSYFYKIGLSVEVVSYISEGDDFLLTVAAQGEDATSPLYLSDGKRLASVIGERLRALHEHTAAACPVHDRMQDYLETVEARAAQGCFDPTFLPKDMHLTSEECLAAVRRAAPCFERDTLLHGDYCLPNILFEDWRPTALIDLGGAGLGDRHVDLFWGAWTLAFNLGTDEYRDRFFDAYGRDRLDGEMLLAVAAAECFA